jgi:hypothetical protein
LGCKGAASGKKAIALIQKLHVPTIGVMVEASSTKSQESSPHGQTPQDSVLEFASRPETHGQMPEAVLRTEAEASL